MRRSVTFLLAALTLCACGADEPAAGPPVLSLEPTATVPATDAPEPLSAEGITAAILDAGLCRDATREVDADEIRYWCALKIEAFDDGWHVTTWAAPPKNYDDLVAALAIIGEATGCWGELEVQTIMATRALDGRVESRNGQASWSYHPDNGLDILCFKD